MKHIIFIKKKFSKTENGRFELPFTTKALVRAVIAAGRRPTPGKKSIAAQADIDMRINALKSAVAMSSSTLVATAEYLSSGSTDKAHKSFFVGDALCAHAAAEELDIPWLVDIERLDTNYKIKKRRTKKRPDFLGKDIHSRWFVFESKGRAESPIRKDLNTWKRQARSIKEVNSRKVNRGIVSAAYLNCAKEWELLWEDPSPGDADAISFDEFAFFVAYYQPIVDYIEQLGHGFEGAGGLLYSSPQRGVSVGLHGEVLSAYREHNASALLSFASRMNHNEVVQSDGSSLFRDGLIIRLSSEWEAENRVLQATPGGSGVISRSQAESSALSPLMNVGKPERETQNRIIALFRDEMHYRYLGDWRDREDNSNIEEKLLTTYLTRNGYTAAQISAALYKLRTEADNPNRSLYDNNKAVYSLLRYGVPVKIEAGKVTETVKLIHWKEPEKNDFAIAERLRSEATMSGVLTWCSM